MKNRAFIRIQMKKAVAEWKKENKLSSAHIKRSLARPTLINQTWTSAGMPEMMR
jgi:hypothetical protein